VEFSLKSKGAKRPFTFTAERMVNAGYVGRNREDVMWHIDELKKHGVPGPSSIPVLYPIVMTSLTHDRSIEVAGYETSGEAEFVLLYVGDGEIYVAAGSDHTDRNLETFSIALSKTICPNVISDEVWRFDDVSPHWDDIELRSWVTRNGERLLYQEGTLGAILTADDLIRFVKSRMDEPLEKTIIYSGTIGTTGGELIFGEHFEVELYSPVLSDSLRLGYDVKPLTYLNRSD